MKERLIVMLVVLIGDGCGVLFSAARLLELFNRVGLKILILESTLSNQLEKFQTGPLPHCLTSIPPIPSFLLQDAAINQSESSIMFLMTIHRTSRRSNLRLDKPISSESLIVRPCTHPTNSISYNPQQYAHFLRKMMMMQKNVSFARLKHQWDLAGVISDLPQNIPTVVINLHNEPMDLSKLTLASVHWDGIANWKMPEYVHWIKKKKNFNPKINQSIIGKHTVFDIISHHNSFDLSGAVLTSQTIVHIINEHVMNAKLRWPRL